MALFGFLVLLLSRWLLLPAEASLTIPTAMLSPLGVPDGLSQSGMTAVKLAVGSRLLNMLGSTGPGSAGTLLTSVLGSQKRPQLGGFPMRFPGITPKSKEFSQRRGPNIPTSFNIREASPTEIENFFGVLHRVDANKCISRLVCEVGANPKIVEGLGHNLKEVMSSARVLEKNTLSQKYRKILFQGQKNGFESCARTYSSCDQKSYRMIRTFVRAYKVRN
ncbi:uncharacterized protein LOC129218049 [Uloborus diversus]|uniref:uncharacterized protein LOC129218049 n=1 Tax=Uloborus diversus TaxID=327109 RepID=UPI00240A56E6|nr:uncharacterized protein LOC129218049 [Uloborus diversus]